MRLLYFKPIRLENWRKTLIYGMSFWAFLLLAITEGLSYFENLNTRGVAIAWLLTAVVLLVAVSQNNKLRGTTRAEVVQPSFRQLFKANASWELSFIALVLVVTAVLSWIAPPNTFDSMTYHMSRVMHWVQNQTVSFYPTTILRQLLPAPWAEYAILHLQLLSGGDRYANFVQWFSLLISLVGVSAIAAELGAKTQGQWWAAVLCASIPMGIMQATSTQTDYAVAMWLVCFAYGCVLFIKTSTLSSAVVVGLALGLACLTKPTAYIFATPFLVWLALDSLIKKPAKTWIQLLVIPVAFVLINVGHFYRSYELTGSPLGQAIEQGEYSYDSQLRTVPAVLSSVMKNIGLHLETGTRLDHWVDRSIFHAHRAIGLAVNDSRTTWPGFDFKVQGLSHHEDYAGNLSHMVLILTTALAYFLFMKRAQLSTIYLAALICSFLLFCGYLRWQPWHSRLQLPLFVLWTPFLALVLEKAQQVSIRDVIYVQFPALNKRSPYFFKISEWMSQVRLGALLVSITVLASLPFLFDSVTKPLFGSRSVFVTPRTEQYFAANPSLMSSYTEVGRYLNDGHCERVGLYGFGNDFEYPLWVLINEGREANPIRIEHIEVGNITKSLQQNLRNQTSVALCAFIVPPWASENPMKVGDVNFYIALTTKALKVYEPKRPN
jgi:hypothetical protein